MTQIPEDHTLVKSCRKVVCEPQYWNYGTETPFSDFPDSKFPLNQPCSALLP